jgi:hypothetical protein
VLNISEELRLVSERATALCGRLELAQLTRRPAPKSWSVAECLTHLRISSEAYYPAWRDAIGRARQAGACASGGEYRLDFTGRLLKWVLEPPPKFRFPAPANFQPIEVGVPEEVLPKFLSSQDQVLEYLRQSEGLPLDRMKITSPFSKNVRYSVWSSFVVTAAHQRRHLLQAERAALAISRT